MAKKKGSRKKNNDALILGIAIGAAATYVLLQHSHSAPCNCQQVQPPVLQIPTRIPQHQQAPNVSRMPSRAARVAQFFVRPPLGYGTLGVYHAL